MLFTLTLSLSVSSVKATHTEPIQTEITQEVESSLYVNTSVSTIIYAYSEPDCRGRMWTVQTAEDAWAQGAESIMIVTRICVNRPS